ncbi:MAG: hypothetical protein Q7R76_06840 [Candidatus Woesearchaeota archaeon]|nr:hypothetical protein [Candidatus Woesearchaeota archaeon]
MVEGIFRSSTKKVQVGENLYNIRTDARLWQSVLVHGQRVSGKLVSSAVSSDSRNKPALEFDLDSGHLKTAMRSSSTGKKR